MPQWDGLPGNNSFSPNNTILYLPPLLEVLRDPRVDVGRLLNDVAAIPGAVIREHPDGIVPIEDDKVAMAFESCGAGRYRSHAVHLAHKQNPFRTGMILGGCGFSNLEGFVEM